MIKHQRLNLSEMSPEIFLKIMAIENIRKILNFYWRSPKFHQHFTSKGVNPKRRVINWINLFILVCQINYSKFSKIMHSKYISNSTF